ncbi:MAG TPA: SRPBCC domain-containing protein [Cyclobacteriaceae bacterium]|nr:SRPBCC domain-containing protein [Cyclobacteriaceae bacterium]
MRKEPKQIRTEIVIQASPEKVWSILTDFKRYPDWNPFIKSIKGDAVAGTKIFARIEPPGASGMNFTPRLLVVQKNTELRWLGHLFVPGLFDGEHIFELYENTDGSTTFVQREIFTGILVSLFTKMLDQNTVAGFDQMNRKLKELAENE